MTNGFEGLVPKDASAINEQFLGTTKQALEAALVHDAELRAKLGGTVMGRSGYLGTPTEMLLDAHALLPDAKDGDFDYLLPLDD